MRVLPNGLLFTRDDARRAGWSDAALTRAVRAGRIRCVRRGLFTAEPTVDPLLAARAAAMACSGSVISHRSAALMHELALLHPAPTRPDLTVPPGRTGDVSSALLHRATLLPEDLVVVDGAEVTSVARTAVDVARTVSVGAGVVTIDSALNGGGTNRSELEALVARCSWWPGIRRAAAALALSDGAAESALESVSRLVISRLHLPTPRTQAVIRDRYGVVVGRCDFYWDEFGVFGEADGRSKYEGREVLTKEKIRQEALENLGLVGVRWGWRDVRFDQPALGRRIDNAFERGRLRDASGFPRKWSVDDA